MKNDSPVAVTRAAALWRLAVVAAACGLFSWRALRFSSFLADDALISLQYTKRLLAGEGLTWCDGNLVEGYSNLL